MGALWLLVACLVAGIVLRRSAVLPEDAPATLNGYVIQLALPALALHHVHKAPLDASFVQASLTSWLLLAAAGFFILLIGRRMGLPSRTLGALVLTAGLANTSFVGLPMIEAHVGAHAMAYGIVIDQLGSYLALSTIGLLLAAICAGESPSWRAVAERVVTFPPFIALVVAVLLRPVALPAALDDALARIGATVAPVALLSVGLQLTWGSLRQRADALALGLAYKLAIGPLTVLLLCMLLWKPSGDQAKLAREVAVFEAAMGPMIGAAVVAARYKLDAQLASLMVGIGIPLSLATAPLWLRAATLLA